MTPSTPSTEGIANRSPCTGCAMKRRGKREETGILRKENLLETFINWSWNGNPKSVWIFNKFWCESCLLLPGCTSSLQLPPMVSLYKEGTDILCNSHVEMKFIENTKQSAHRFLLPPSLFPSFLPSLLSLSLCLSCKNIPYIKLSLINSFSCLSQAMVWIKTEI